MVVQEKMQQLVNALKLLDARDAAKDIMYGWKRMFKQRDKPRKHLARLPAEIKVNRKSPVLNEAGQKVAHPQQKVEVFA